MSASLSLSEARAPRLSVPAYLKSKSEISARFARVKGETRVGDLYEAGCSRLRFPRAERDCHGVLVNTAGGMTGGDEAVWSYTLAAGARVELTTQSAEKIYRSDGEPAQVRVEVKLGKRANLAWIPQEVILFNGAKFSRRLDVDMDEGAQLTVLEISLFGRSARGEKIDQGSFHDRWIVRRQGRILFAESVKLDGDVAATLAEPAVGSGACAVATLLHVSPTAEKRLGAARKILSRATSDCGASAWDGMLVARFVSGDAAAVRRDAALLAARFLRRGLPRIWSI
jgi:urease accessory protein